jgi:hypothetical protein
MAIKNEQKKIPRGILLFVLIQHFSTRSLLDNKKNRMTYRSFKLLLESNKLSCYICILDKMGVG